MADVPTYGGRRNLRRGPVFCCMITEKQAERLRSQQQEIDFSHAPINAWSFGNLSCGHKQREMTSCIQADWNDVTGEAEFKAVRTKIENRKTNESKDKAAKLDEGRNSNDKKIDKMTEKKIYFLFFCQMDIEDEPYWAWTLSLPFLVAVQTLQEWNLLGVIFWDTCFSALDSIPCQGRSEVTWTELKLALKWLFQSQVQADIRGDSITARELTDEELHHLGTRIFGRLPFSDETIVRRSEVFNKIICEMTGKKYQSDQKGFTFWQWFYACMDLLQDRSGKILRYHNGKCRKRSVDEKRTMATLFNEGIIRGFVNRESAERVLRSCGQTNIMLIRFSDNHCRHEESNSVPAAYLSITCKAMKDGRDTVVNIKPLNRELLTRLTLPFVVAHCEYLNNVNYIYVGQDRLVEKKRLTINYIPILTEYTQYEGYEKLLLNLNNEHSDENPSSGIHSPQTWSTPTSSPSVIPHTPNRKSPFSDSSAQSTAFLELNTSSSFATASANGGSAANSASIAPTRLVDLLTEPPSRHAAIPSKYDEVLSYLISSTESTLSPNLCPEFQPEDDETLCRTFNFQ